MSSAICPRIDRVTYCTWKLFATPTWFETSCDLRPLWPQVVAQGWFRKSGSNRVDVAPILPTLREFSRVDGSGKFPLASERLVNSFHSAAFELLERPLLRSPEAALEIVGTEQRIGFALPSSVREWYGYRGAVEILAKFSNDDPPIAVSSFTVTHWKSNRLIPFRNENQGVCVWAILLDGSEDPPVCVDVDSGGREWHVLASTFSAYVRTCIWDYKVVLQQAALLQAQGGPLSPVAVQQLESICRPEPMTRGWPGSTQYRFQGDGFAILIWSSEDQADWFLSGESEASLQEGRRAIAHIDKIGQAFYRTHRS